MIHVLYLDDESHNLTAFRAAFRRVFKVHVTTEPTEAVQILREHPIEVVISDQKMPALSGVEFFELIMSDFPDPIRMLLTGHADIDAVIGLQLKLRLTHQQNLGLMGCSHLATYLRLCCTGVERSLACSLADAAAGQL